MKKVGAGHHNLGDLASIARPRVGHQSPSLIGDKVDVAPIAEVTLRILAQVARGAARKLWDAARVWVGRRKGRDKWSGAVQ
jgi:hypothetical protein